MPGKTYNAALRASPVHRTSNLLADPASRTHWLANSMHSRADAIPPFLTRTLPHAAPSRPEGAWWSIVLTLTVRRYGGLAVPLQGRSATLAALFGVGQRVDENGCAGYGERLGGHDGHS